MTETIATGKLTPLMTNERSGDRTRDTPRSIQTGPFECEYTTAALYNFFIFLTNHH